MAVSKMLLLQTELGQAQIFCNNERAIHVKIGQEESGENVTIRGVQYYLHLVIKKVDAPFGFKEWKVIEESSSIYRIYKGDVSPSAKGKIESSLLAFVKNWTLTKEGEKLLRETEVQDRLEKVLSLTKKETELKSELEKLSHQIDEATFHWEQAKKEYGIE